MEEYKDRILICLDCGKEFLFTVGEQIFFIKKGFVNQPLRCGKCRHIRKQDHFNNVKDQTYSLGRGIESAFLDFYNPSKEIIVPTPQITEDITLINKSLFETAQKNPSVVYEFNSYEFEEFICELLEKRGYNVKLTQKTRDGGKDIIVVENNFLGNFLIYVECKKYRPDRPVGVSLIREFYGVISMDNVTAGMLITTSYFSKDAVELSETFRHRISLIDYNKLVEAIQVV